MAVGPGVPFNQHTGNGVTKTFAYGFTLLNAADLSVLVEGVASTDYTVSGIGNAVGGSITFGTAPATGARVVLLLQIDIARATEYQNNGDLLATTVNSDFDRLWQALGVVNYLAGQRALRVPFDEVLGELPDAAERANGVQAYDSAGQPTIIDLPTLPVTPLQTQATITATEGQTLFPVSFTYTRGNGSIFFIVDGRIINSSQYNQLIGFIEYLPGLSAGQEVDIIGGTLLNGVIGGDAVSDTALESQAGDTLIGTGAEGAGAVLRTQSEVNRDIVNAEGYGFGEDKTAAQNVAAVTAAHAVCPRVWMRPGRFAFTSFAFVTTLGLIGAGEQRTILEVNQTTQDIITVNNLVVAVNDFDCSFELRDFSIKHTGGGTPTGGAGVKIIYSAYGHIENVRTFGLYDGLVLNTVQTCSVNRFKSFFHRHQAIALGKNCLDNTFYNCWGVGRTSAADPTIITGSIGLALYSDATTLPAQIEGNVFNDCRFVSNDQPLTIGGTSFTARQCPSFNKFNGCYFDTSKQASVLNNSRDNQFNNCWFASSEESNLVVQSSDNDQFVGCQSYAAAEFGVYVLAGAARFSWIGGACRDNSTSSIGTYEGMNFAPGVSYFTVIGMKGDNTAGISATQSRAIRVQAGASDHYLIQGVSGEGCINGVILDEGTGTDKTVTGNPGYNPMAATGMTVGASPLTLTNNTGAPVVYWVYGGTVSSVTVNGRSVATATNCQAVVPQGKSMVVTYTVAPTIERMGLV